VQSKLREEIINHTDKDGKVDFETLSELPYLDQVFNESLRMHSPAVMTSRKCTEPTYLEYQGSKVFIEHDMNLLIPIHSIHYDPELYPKPEEFLPERFDEENGGIKAFKDRCIFLPFGDGNCHCM